MGDLIETYRGSSLWYQSLHVMKQNVWEQKKIGWQQALGAPSSQSFRLGENRTTSLRLRSVKYPVCLVRPEFTFLQRISAAGRFPPQQSLVYKDMCRCRKNTVEFWALSLRTTSSETEGIFSEPRISVHPDIRISRGSATDWRKSVHVQEELYLRRHLKCLFGRVVLNSSTVLCQNCEMFRTTWSSGD